MKKNTKVTISLMIIILIVAIVGIIYKENQVSIKKLVGTTQEQQIEEVDVEAEKNVEIVEDSNEFSTETTGNSNIEPEKGEIVTVSGVIKNTKKSKDNQHLFVTLTDSIYGELLVPIFSNSKIDQTQFINGLNLEVTGKVDHYYEQLEVIPRNNDDIFFSNNTSSGFITNNDLDKEVVVEGTILSVYDHPDGHLILTIMTKVGQEITIPLFSSLSPNSGNYRENTKIQVKGTVNLYKEKLQVTPDNLFKVKIVSITEEIKDRMILSKAKAGSGMFDEALQIKIVKDWNC